MSGIKIHEYPDTATSLNDLDFYDADVFNGIGYDSKKVPGSVIKTDIINAAAVDSRFEITANKAVTMIGNSTSNIFYLSAKAVYDWATSLFVAYTRTVNGYNLGSDITLSTNDILDSTNKRYQTDAQKVTFTNPIWTVELIDALTVNFYASYGFQINSVTNITNSPTTTILVNNSAYTFGVAISTGDKITVTVNVAGVVNLNTTRL